MLNRLTKYLIQYKRVFIPHAGTIEIVPQPAVLNFAEKLLFPPTYLVQLKSNDFLSEHQLLQLAGGNNADVVKQELYSFGENLQKSVSAEEWNWNGIAKFSSTRITPLLQTPLAPITAERVVRKGAEHNVLVGDRDVSSHHRHQKTATAKRRKSNAATIGWIVLAAAVLAIAYILYTNNFQGVGSGLRMKP